MSGATNTANAQCLSTSAETNTFNQYIASCRKGPDVTRAANFFGNANQDFKEAYQLVKAEYDNLITTGNGTNDLATLSGTTVSQTDSRISSLTKKKDLLLAEIKAIKAQGEAADRSFMNEIVNGNPQAGPIPSLQDMSLLLFWFAWIVMLVTLVGVRWSSAGFTGAVYTFVILFLVTMVVYGILQQVA
jgi:hypothetical protein